MSGSPFMIITDPTTDFGSYPTLKSELLSRPGEPVGALYSAGGVGSGGGYLGSFYSDGVNIRQATPLNLANAANSTTGVVDGDQAATNTLAMVTGHGIVDGDRVSILTVAAGVPVCFHRLVSGAGANTITVDGAAISVLDGDLCYVEGVADSALTGLITPQAGAACFFDGLGMVSSLDYVSLGDKSNLAVSTSLRLYITGESQLLIAGSPAADAFAGVGWRADTSARQFLGVIGLDVADWKTRVRYAAASLASGVGTITAPSHADLISQMTSNSRNSAGANVASVNSQGSWMGDHDGYGNTTWPDSIPGQNNVLPFCVHAADGVDETIGIRLFSFYSEWRD